MGMRSVALRHLPITPDTYWRLLPGELADMLDGVSHREEREWERAAWVTAHLMNVAGKVLKKPVRPTDLLRRQVVAMTYARPVQPEVEFGELIRRQKGLEGSDG